MLPLLDRRILITRPRGQSSALGVRLAELGAEPILIPTIEIAPPASFCALDAALTAIRSFDRVAFTSANAVHGFVQRARQLGLQQHPRRIAVVGPATAAAVQGSGLSPDDPELLMPARYVAEALAEALRPHADGSVILLPRAAGARDLLPETLTEAGARVTIVEAYRTVIPPASIAELMKLFSSRPPDAITFTSGSTAHHLAALLASAGLRVPGATMLASIGPITSQAMREHELEPTIEAAESTVRGLVQAIVSAFSGW